MGVIVVGVDGSEGSNHALDYAAEEAVLRGARLRLVGAWEIPPSVLTAGMASKDFYEGFERQALAAVREAAVRIAGQYPSVACEEVVAEGQAAKVLLANAEDADLLVVGRRGYGTFREMLLGSVSRQLTVHAKCPLLLVPPPLSANEDREDGE